ACPATRPAHARRGAPILGSLRGLAGWWPRPRVPACLPCASILGAQLSWGRAVLFVRPTHLARRLRPRAILTDRRKPVAVSLLRRTAGKPSALLAKRRARPLACLAQPGRKIRRRNKE
ncbi:unnamed protein product, partial [Amoebophrya sp. A120]